MYTTLTVVRLPSMLHTLINFTKIILTRFIPSVEENSTHDSKFSKLQDRVVWRWSPLYVRCLKRCAHGVYRHKDKI